MRRRCRRLAPLLVVLCVSACAGSRTPVQADADGQNARYVAAVGAPPARAWQTIGRSVEGRPIRALVVGSAQSPRRILVVGCVHGDEAAGEAITRRLRSAVPPAGTALWVVDEINPDGCRAHTRQNAHGVDLNRNSPWHWQHLSGIFDSGTGPLSEPESRAINRLVRAIRPAVTIWYHQHAALVDDSGGDRGIEQRYGRLVGLPFRHFGSFPGSITGWQNAAFARTTAFVVELPAGRLSAPDVARHAAAVLALARG